MTTTSMRSDVRVFDYDTYANGDPERQPYDRPPPSKQLLAGAWSAADCVLAGEAAEVTWEFGRRAIGLDRGRRVVVLDDGEGLAYDGLAIAIATGRRVRPWADEMPASGVHTMRTLGDAAAFRAEVVPESSVVIVGAGFIGCEVVATLRAEGVDVTVVDVAKHPRPAVGEVVGARSIALHETHGVRFRMGRGVAGIEGGARVTGARLDDGEVLPATVVLVAVGSVPNTEWLGGSGIAIERGAVVCDATCTVLDADGNVLRDIVAAADAAAWPHRHADGAVSNEHWSNARDMADLAAKNLLVTPGERQELAPLAAVPTFWSDQSDVKIKSAGYLRAADSWVMVEEDPEKRSFLVEGYRGDELVAAVAFNMNRSIIRYYRVLAEPVTV